MGEEVAVILQFKHRTRRDVEPSKIWILELNSEMMNVMVVGENVEKVVKN